MWKGVLGLGETRMVAGDFDGNTLTDAMVIIHRRDGTTRLLAFMSNGLRMIKTSPLAISLASADWQSVRLAAADYGVGGRQVALLLCPATPTGSRILSVGLNAKGVLRKKILGLSAAQLPAGSQLSVGDTDGDTRDETAVLRWTSAGVKLTLFEREASGLVKSSEWAGALPAGSKLTMGDVDGDTHDEVLTLSSSSTGGILRVFEVEGSTLTPSALSGLPMPTSCRIATADVLGDGRSQVITLQKRGLGTALVAYKYSGTGLEAHRLWMGTVAFSSTQFDGRRSLPAIVYPGVHITSTQAMTDLVAYSDHTAVFAGTPPDIADLSAGDVLLLPPSSETPDGVMGRVASVADSAGYRYVGLRPASLRDVFKQCEISVEAPSLDVSPKGDVPIVTSAVNSNRSSGSTWLPIYNFVDNKIQDPKGEQSMSLSGQVWAYFGVMFNYAPLMGGDSSYLKLAAGEKVDPPLTARFDCTVDVLKLFDKSIARWKLTDFKFSVAGIPVWVTVKLNLDASAGVKGKASAKAVVKESWEGQVGVQSNPWHLVFDSTPTFSGTFPGDTSMPNGKNPSGNIDARADLKLKLSFLLYDTVGGYGGIGPFLRAYASTSEDPWWKLYAGLAATAGLRLQVPFWDWTLWNQEWKWDIWQTTLAQAELGDNPVDLLPPDTVLMNRLPVPEGVDQIGWINGPEYAWLFPDFFGHRFLFFSSDRGSRQPVARVEAKSDLWSGWKQLPRELRLLYNHKLGQSMWVPSWTNFLLDVKPVEGRHTISWRAVDRASPAHVESVYPDNYIEFGMDFHAPITTASAERVLLATKVTFAAADYVKVGVVPSGLSYTEYEVDDGLWNRLEGSSIMVVKPGEHVVSYASVDVAGNREATKTMKVFNITPPL